jgi:hypothetical protein
MYPLPGSGLMGGAPKSIDEFPSSAPRMLTVTVAAHTPAAERELRQSFMDHEKLSTKVRREQIEPQFCAMSQSLRLQENAAETRSGVQKW